MLIILLTLATTITARPTRSFVRIENNADYRSFLPVTTFKFTFGTSNGRRPQFEHTTQYSDVNLSDNVQQGEGSTHRRIDTQFNYENPNRGGNGQLDRRLNTNNQFDGRRKNWSDVITENNTTVRMDIPRNETRDTQHTDKVDNGNIQRVNEHTTSLQNNTNIQFEVNKTIEDVPRPEQKSVNNTTDNGNKNIVNKTTADNEVAGASRAGDEDRWIWSNSNDTVETTTPFPLTDRAAFGASGCPSGTVMFAGACVQTD